MTLLILLFPRNTSPPTFIAGALKSQWTIISAVSFTTMIIIEIFRRCLAFHYAQEDWCADITVKSRRRCSPLWRPFSKIDLWMLHRALFHLVYDVLRWLMLLPVFTFYALYFAFLIIHYIKYIDFWACWWNVMVAYRLAPLKVYHILSSFSQYLVRWCYYTDASSYWLPSSWDLSEMTYVIFDWRENFKSFLLSLLRSI